MPEQPFISADSHVVEPADLWSTRLEKAFRDRAPSLVMNPVGKRDSISCVKDSNHG